MVAASTGVLTVQAPTGVSAILDIYCRQMARSVSHNLTGMHPSFVLIASTLFNYHYLPDLPLSKKWVVTGLKISFRTDLRGSESWKFLGSMPLDASVQKLLVNPCCGHLPWPVYAFGICAATNWGTDWQTLRLNPPEIIFFWSRKKNESNSVVVVQLKIHRKGFMKLIFLPQLLYRQNYTS